MRLVVACCWAPGEGQGISTLAWELAGSFARAGHDVYYIAPKASGQYAIGGNTIRGIDIGPDLAPADGTTRVVQELRQIKADAIINNDHPYVQAAYPAIASCRISISHAMAWATARLARFNEEHAESIVAISYDMYRQLRDAGVSPAKLALIENGIDVPVIDRKSDVLDRVRARDEIRAVFAGNWTRVKGADLILKMLRQTSRACDWLSIDGFGLGPFERDAKLLAHPSLSMHGRVARGVFLESLSRADVLLLPSRREGCPVTVIEAMALGVVPIVSDGVGGMRFMVSSGIDGFVLDLHKWSAQAWEALEYLRRNRPILDEMKSAAFRKYEQRYRIEIMRESIEAIIHRAPRAFGRMEDALELIKWHRPVSSTTYLENFLSKVAYRMGMLRRSGALRIS